MNFRYDADYCNDLDRSLRCEWLETNSLGGYAASTIHNCHTRKYHGLLVPSLPAVGGRFLLLSKVDVNIRVNGNVYCLATNKYPGTYEPRGYQHVKSVDCEMYPHICYQVEDSLFELSILMPQKQNTILLKYQLTSSSQPITLYLHPLFAYRNIHTLTRENMHLRVKTYVHNNYCKIDPYAGMPPMYFDTSLTSMFYSGPYWNHNVEYLEERNRGFDSQEDLFCPGVIEVQLQPKQALYFRASLALPDVPAETLWKREVQRREEEWSKFSDKTLPMQALHSRASQCLIHNATGKKSIIAGYPWFDEWGRDALIALPGLTFYRGDIKSGVDVLKTFTQHRKDGLLPNFLGIDGKTHAYNSVDASLWFFWAVQEFQRRTGDIGTIRAFFVEPMLDILEHFYRGDVSSVTLHDNSLIWVGDENTQLTWMDAKVHDKPVTPRYGFVVELNALWFNALSYYRALCDSLNISYPQHFEKIRRAFKKNFISVFWNDECHYLADVVNEKGQDMSIRPNQLFAASLPYSALTITQMHQVMDCIEKNLLTSYGLRTLAPDDPHYHPYYSGSSVERDSAYHQGTVWPWLIGHFTEAAINISQDKTATRKQLMTVFHSLFSEHLRDGCIGGISEIFDASTPHNPNGCIQQAWSIGEVIRAYDMLNVPEAS